MYTIYRSSEAFIIPEDDLENYRFDDSILEDDSMKHQQGANNVAMGQMYLIFNKALLISCSTDVLFFKLEYN